jgi:hypothetical protein
VRPRLLYPLHGLVDDRRAVAVERTRALTGLKKTSGFCAVPRITGWSCVRASERPIEHQFEIDHPPHVITRQECHVRDLMRGAEGVEEVQKRDARLQGSAVCDESEIVRFLHARRAEHGPAGGSCGHDVAVIAEDRQGPHLAECVGDSSNRIVAIDDQSRTVCC